MSFSLNSFSSEIKKLLIFFSEISKKTNSEIYLVGGVVRDLIMNNSEDFKPKDLDIMLCPDFNEFFNELKIQNISSEYSFDNFKLDLREEFRTAKLLFSDDLQDKIKFSNLDFSSSRKEIYLTPASKPQITEGNLKEDLFRRDFRINAMALKVDPNGSLFLIDLFNGLKDVDKKLLRVLHTKSFIDDPARLIRGARFSARFSFEYDEKTKALVEDAINQEYLKRLTFGRIASEFRKALEENSNFLDLYKKLIEINLFDLISQSNFLSEREYTEIIALENFLDTNYKEDNLKKAYFRFQLLWQSEAWPWEMKDDESLSGLISIFSKSERSEINKSRQIWREFNINSLIS